MAVQFITWQSVHIKSKCGSSDIQIRNRW